MQIHSLSEEIYNQELKEKQHWIGNSIRVKPTQWTLDVLKRDQVCSNCYGPLTSIGCINCKDGFIKTF